MNTKTESTISQTSKFITTALGAITFLCVTTFYLNLPFIRPLVVGIAYGQLLSVETFYRTVPVAIVCTLLSVRLVGLRRSKLAWMSLCLYPLFFVVLYISDLCALHH